MCTHESCFKRSSACSVEKTATTSLPREADISDTGTEDTFASAAIESPVDIEPRDGPVPKEPELSHACCC